MNNNMFGTIAAIIAILLGAMTQIFGCSTDATTEVSVCTASWIPPQYAGYVVLVFSGLAIGAKLFRAGGPLHGLFGKSVIVVKDGDSKPGVVSPTQVG